MTMMPTMPTLPTTPAQPAAGGTVTPGMPAAGTAGLFGMLFQAMLAVPAQGGGAAPSAPSGEVPAMPPGEGLEDEAGVMAAVLPPPLILQQSLPVPPPAAAGSADNASPVPVVVTASPAAVAARSATVMAGPVAADTAAVIAHPAAAAAVPVPLAVSPATAADQSAMAEAPPAGSVARSTPATRIESGGMAGHVRLVPPTSDAAPEPVDLKRPALVLNVQDLQPSEDGDRLSPTASSSASTPPLAASAMAGQESRAAAATAWTASTVPSAHHVLPARPDHLAQDVGSLMARQVAAGDKEVLIRLDPAELGRIDVRMNFAEDGQLRAVITADNSGSFDLLRRDADTLARSLADAGIKADAQNLRFDLRQDQGQGQSQGQWQQPDRRHGQAHTDLLEEPTASGDENGRGRLV